MKKRFVYMFLALLCTLLGTTNVSAAGTVVGYTEAINGSSLDGRVLSNGELEHLAISGPVYGSNITDNGSKTVYIDGATYTNTKSWRKSQNNTYDGQNVGYELTVGAGYKMNVSKVNARIAVADDTYTWYVEILNSAGTQVWKSSERTTTKTSSDKIDNVDVTDKDALKGLSGTITVNLWVKQGGSTKYYSINYLQLEVEVEEDARTNYTVTASVADGQSAYGSIDKGGENTVIEGGGISLTATANNGYAFVNWTKDNEVVSTSSTLVLSNVTADAAYVAHFMKLHKVTYNLGDYAGTLTGKVLCSYNAANNINEIYANTSGDYTIPAYASKYLYREGYVFAGWECNGNTYANGQTVEGLTSDITITPTWTATTATLATSPVATQVTWSFAKADIVFMDWQSSDKYGYYTQTPTVNGEKIAVPMKIINGKVGNYGRTDDKAQTNQGTTFTIPAVSGMTISIPSAYKEFSTTTIAGSTAYTGTGTKSISYTYTGTDETIDIVIGESSQYLSSIVVTYPAIEQRQASDLTLTSEADVTLTAAAPTSQITATTSATVGLTYTTSNPLIATVSSTGLITAVANGTATITVSQNNDENYQDDTKTVTVTVNNGVMPSYSVSAILNNETGTILLSEECDASLHPEVNFGINTAGERVDADSEDAVVVISGIFWNDHGFDGLTATVKATGNMKITIGNCSYNKSTATITNANNETVATQSLSGTGCWKGGHTDVTTIYYEGAATTLTVNVPSYCPYFAVESVSQLEKNTVTFMNGSELATTIEVVDGSAIGTLPAAPSYDNTTRRFRGWFAASDGSEGKVTASTVPSGDVTYYAVYADIPVTTAGYYMPNDGLELANVLEYLEETSASSAKIFLKNGTYTLPRGAVRHYTHTNTKTNAVLWDGDAYDPITYLKTSNVSFIGQSRDGVVITNVEPNTSDYNFAGQYGNANIYEGIGNSDVIQIDGSVSGLYWQDLTVSTGMADGYGRDIAIQDKGTRNIYKNVCLHGYQDTWTSNKDDGLYYFEDGVVRGRTDYLCGKGDIYFNRVELRQIAGGYAAVPSKPANIGWVFKDCTITGEGSGVTGNYTLGRPWGSGTPVAVFIDTKMEVVPSAIGWSEMSGGWPARFAEYNSVDANDNTVDLSSRKTSFGSTGNIHSNNPVLTASEAEQYADMNAMYGDWNPAQYTVQAEATNVVLSGATLSWEGTSDAYLIEKDGEFVALTDETSFTVDASGLYTVRAANGRGGMGEASPAVSYYAITLTTTENMRGYRTFYNADKDFVADENTKAYVAQQKNEEESTVTLSPLSDRVIPAGTPVILKTTTFVEADGATAAHYEMKLTETVALDYTETNLLQVTAGGENFTSGVYRLAYKKADNAVGFYTWTTASAEAGIVYLPKTNAAGAKLSFRFLDEVDDEEQATAISSVKEEAYTADGKAYNAAGQQVGNSYKGLVVKNGKKFINK